MDTVLSRILAASSAQELLELNLFLDQCDEVLLKSGGNIDTVLGHIILPRNHSIGFVHLLHSRQISHGMDHAAFCHQVERLLMEGDFQQLRIVPRKFSALLARYTQLLLDSNNAIRGVRPLQAAVQAAAKHSPNELTPAHVHWVLLCVKSKCYHVAYAHLTREQPLLVTISPDQSGISSSSIVNFHFYAGLVCIARKDFQRAIEYLQTSFTLPATDLTEAMVGAYKKYILCSLIANGQVPPLPPYTSRYVEQGIRRMAGSYLAFASAFESNKPDAMNQIAQEYRPIFAHDRNEGLVKQALSALKRRNIHRLTHTYMTLSLADMAKAVNLESPAQAEQCVLQMINSGEVFATMNKRDGMVSFNDNAQAYNDEATVSEVHRRVDEVLRVAEVLGAADQAVSLDPSYLTKLNLQERHRKHTAAGDHDDIYAYSLA